jgi:MFS family permease
MVKINIPKIMRTFSIIWFGQLISTLGSGLTGFALGVWVYQETGSTTMFAMNMLAYAIPNLVVSPFAGALVDRFDRRLVMIMSDAGAGLTTLAIVILLYTGNLEVWHVYIATAISAAFTTFQWPAFSAVTTLLVPKEHLGRAGGMTQIGEAISQLLSPAIAGVLFVTTGLIGVVLIDFATFAFAVLTLFFISVPKPKVTKEGLASKGSLLKEATYGWRYIVARRGLFGLLIVFALTNFFSGLWGPLLSPMLLDMTDPKTLGFLASIVGIGMLLGTIVMSVWGGPKRRIHGVLGFLILSGVFAFFLGMTPSIYLIAVAGFGLLFVSPIVNGSSQALWQSKVAPDVQGRVFSVRRMIAWSTMPLAYIIAGPIADNVFKPLLVEGGPLADSVGLITGVGPGRGIGLMIMTIGVATILTVTLGYLHPRVRLVEDEVPDAVQDEPTAEEVGGETPLSECELTEEGKHELDVLGERLDLKEPTLQTDMEYT